MATPIRFDRPVLRPFESVEEGTPLRPKEAKTADGSSFADLFKRALNDASGLQDDAQETIRAFLRGDPVELHQVMAASEEAAISLELLVEIRNKLTDAYRTVMNVQ